MAKISGDPEALRLRARIAALARIPERAGELAPLRRELAILGAIRTVRALPPLTPAERRRISGALPKGKP